MLCLEYSLDGEYLASGSSDGSIRIWNRESCNTTSSQANRERPTRTLKQADTNPFLNRTLRVLSFSRTDTNILASGGDNGEIKVWNIKEQACIHTVNLDRGPIHSLVFAGGEDTACIALAGASVIRIWKPKGASDFTIGIIGDADVSGHTLRAEFSLSGSFLTTSSLSRAGDGNKSTLALYVLEPMTKTQSVVMPGFVAACIGLSPDSKQLVIGGHKGRIHLLQTDNFSIQRDLDATAEAKTVCSVAFDATCRVLAIGSHNGGLELRSL
jgi:WD40 repeat protein